MLLLFFFPLEADRDGFDPCVLREGLLVLRHRFLQLADLLLKAFLGVEDANGSKRRDKKRGSKLFRDISISFNIFSKAESRSRCRADSYTSGDNFCKDNSADVFADSARL